MKYVEQQSSVSFIPHTQQINMFNSQMNVNMMSLKLITTEISLSLERIKRRLQLQVKRTSRQSPH